jgi:hypothetical protein
MENLMVPLTVASIYYLISYLIKKKNIDLYTSFFIMGIVLSMKMTVVPFFVGCLAFLFILSQKSDLLSNLYEYYIKDIPKVFLLSFVIYLMLLYVVESLNVVKSGEVFIPFLTNIYASNFIYAFAFVYIFIIISILKVLKIFKISNLNKKLITCFLIGISPKIVEIILGLLVGGYDYISQCYGINSGRSGLLPFATLYHIAKMMLSFYFIDPIILCGWGVLIILLLYLLLLKLIGDDTNTNANDIGRLLFTLFVCVLFAYSVFPTLPVTIRFIYPTYIIFLISSTYWMWNKIQNIKYKNIIIFSLLTLLLTNFSIALMTSEKTGFYYDDGTYKCGNDINSLNKIYSYLESNNLLNKTIFSTSPSPTAYLNINAYPKYTDTFAPIFMEKNESKVINDLKKDSVDYFLMTPWGFACNLDKKEIGKFAMLNHTLTYSVGNEIATFALYDLKTPNKNNYTFYISKGNLIIADFNNTNLNINLNAKEYELIYTKNNSYILKYSTANKNNITSYININRNSLSFNGNESISIPLNNKIIIIDGNITYIDKKEIPLNNVSSIVVFSDDKINITGNIKGVINNSELTLYNPNITIIINKGYHELT